MIPQMGYYTVFPSDIQELGEWDVEAVAFPDGRMKEVVLTNELMGVLIHVYFDYKGNIHSLCAVETAPKDNEGIKVDFKDVVEWKGRTE